MQLKRIINGTKRKTTERMKKNVMPKLKDKIKKL